jgi:hypothetical protein
MSTHTPGRLEAKGQRITGPLGISVAHCSDGFTTGISGDYEILEREAKANARRLVAAWNYFEKIGWTTEEIEAINERD